MSTIMRIPMTDIELGDRIEFIQQHKEKQIEHQQRLDQKINDLRQEITLIQSIQEQIEITANTLDYELCYAEAHGYL